MERRISNNILPVEVIENIFAYLTIDDVKSASLVCRGWFAASFNPGLVSRTKLSIENEFSSKNDLYKILVRGSMKKFTTLKFTKVIFDDSDIEDQVVWIQLGRTITDLTFKWCNISERKLFSILDNFPNLSKLSLVFEVNQELDSNKILSKYVDKLTSLVLKRTCPFNEECFLEICNKNSSIENLRLEITEYPDIYSMTPTVKILEKLSINLKSLSLYFYREGIDLLECLPRFENLRLESLFCHMYDEIEESMFTKFIHKLSSLSSLDISPGYLGNTNFIEICTYMPNLKSLRINECDAVSNKGIIEVTRLKNLEELIIRECHNVSNIGIINGIAKNRNEKMKNICLSGYFSDDSIIGISQNLPNLRKLQVNTILFISERCVRTIFEHLRWLRILQLNSLNSESDYDMFEKHEVEQNLVPSKSEQFKISSIKGLRELSLKGFSDIPGASIEDISELKELQSLQISYNNNLIKNTIDDLLKKCICLKQQEIYGL